jgi:hypothetical protein
LAVEDIMDAETLGDNWDDDTYEDIRAQPEEFRALIVSSRDWTVETIISQIEQKNIDLNPAFQRRNAWDDKRRSKLIESLITGLPVPEIVLAETPQEKHSYIVIDGKQRLLTIAGFIDPENYNYWIRPVLKALTVRKDLNGKGYMDLKEGFSSENRMLMNAAVRCTIISNFQGDQVLYDIFYRLNTGSVSLSTQELRQVLNRGAFADYLVKATSQLQPIHIVMGLSEPDKRLRDTEMVLRYICIELFGKDYRANLSKFLDDSMAKITKDWNMYFPKVESIFGEFNKSIRLLIETLGDPKRVGRKYADGEWATSFNKVLFEAQVYYFARLTRLKKKLHQTERDTFIKGFQKLCENSDFRDSIESSTKDNTRYNLRFSKLRDLVNKAFNTTITDVPIPAKVSTKK